MKLLLLFIPIMMVVGCGHETAHTVSDIFTPLPRSMYLITVIGPLDSTEYKPSYYDSTKHDTIYAGSLDSPFCKRRVISTIYGDEHWAHYSLRKNTKLFKLKTILGYYPENCIDGSNDDERQRFRHELATDETGKKIPENWYIENWKLIGLPKIDTCK